MITTEEYIDETRLNTHQTHFEDLVITGDLLELNNKIDSFIEYIENGTDTGANYTQKLDGAPAVMVWHKFEGYPDNSISLKSFVGGPKNSLSTIEEIEAKYGDRPDMSEKLKYCLEIAPQIPSGEAWQGDCMFIQSDLKVQEIKGTEYLTFHPNKIVYAISEDQPSYNKIKNSKFGIAFHTIYTQGEDGEKKQSFRIDPERLQVPDDIYIMSPAISVNRDRNKYNFDNVKQNYSELKKLEKPLLNNPEYEELVNNSTFMNYWNTFENKNTSDKQSTHLNINTFYNDLKEYVEDKVKNEYDKKVSTLKSDKGRLNAKDKYERLINELRDIINSRQDLLVNIVKAFNKAVDIKMDLWQGLKEVKGEFSTFYKSKTKGFLDADIEGIAVSDSDGNIVKIVDRSTFSSFNRDPDIESGFEHESLDTANSKGSWLSRLRSKRSKMLQEDTNHNLAIVCFGRMNPPTIGHKAMVDFMNSLNGDVRIYLSHSQDPEKNPLPYDRKIHYANLAFNNQVVESPAVNMYQVLTEVCDQGYTDVIYVCGSDRFKQAEIMKRYNGIPDKKGNIIYKFNSLEVRQFGDERISEDIEIEKASASLARQCVKEDNFDMFKDIVPFEENVALNLFEELKEYMGISESYVESHDSYNDIYNELKDLHESTIINKSTEYKLINKSTEYKLLKSKLVNLAKSHDLRVVESTRHSDDGEILRVSINDQFNKETLVNLFKDYVNTSNLPYEIPEDCLVTGISGKYESVKIIPRKDHEELSTCYITIADKYKKVFTPNKTIKKTLMGKSVNYISLASNLSNNFEGVDLRGIYESAIRNSSANKKFDIHEDSYFTAQIDINLVKNLSDDKINGLIVDFGEVLSAGCLAHIIDPAGAKVSFPSGSNEPLVDFTIESTKLKTPLKVSQKAGQGAIPSCESAFSLLVNSNLDKNKTQNNFYNWMFKNVTSVNIHEGFVNLAKLATGIDHQDWYEEINDLDASKFKKYLISDDIIDINMFDAEFSKVMDKSKLGIKTNVDKVSNVQYYKTIVIRWLSRVAITNINNSELIKKFNQDFNLLLGSFIQVYLNNNKNEFKNGKLNFTYKLISENNNYKLVDASAIGKKDYKLGMKRLCIALK